MLTSLQDPESRGDREDRRRPPPLHQATAHQEPQVPAPTPQPTEDEWQGIRRKETSNILLDSRLETLERNGVHIMVVLVHPKPGKSTCRDQIVHIAIYQWFENEVSSDTTLRVVYHVSWSMERRIF